MSWLKADGGGTETAREIASPTPRSVAATWGLLSSSHRGANPSVTRRIPVLMGCLKCLYTPEQSFLDVLYISSFALF